MRKLSYSSHRGTGFAHYVRGKQTILLLCCTGWVASCSVIENQAGDKGILDGGMDSAIAVQTGGRSITGGNLATGGVPATGGQQAGTGGETSLLCTPTTCEESGAACGAVSDGCGQVLLCGTCQANEICNAEMMTCEAPEDACEAAGRSCGVLADACGAAVGCGRCLGTEVCDARTGQCGPCQPRTCGDNTCGIFSDGCGDTLNCGECGGDLVCDAFSQRCTECVPTTCEEQGVLCGPLSDGCGDVLDCDAERGGCPSGLQCIAQLCRAPEQPLECDLQMANCGTITQSCDGSDVDCGECPEGELCVDNRCESCVPHTCEDLEWICGNGDDGCGGTLNCGVCPIPEDTPDSPPVCINHECCSPPSCEVDACGSVENSCGASIDCGACPSGEYCGIATANVCTPCTPETCEPNMCARVKAGDGCGNKLNCGGCPQDGVPEGEISRCNTAANVCEPCTLEVCSAGECGTKPDGCGGELQCDACDPGEYCGISTANVCTPCTPKTCGPDDCGSIDDTCGGSIDCDGCVEGKGCGIVTANVCSACPPPKTCGADDCGTSVDSCGVATDCQGCGAGKQCGIVTANVCDVCTPRECSAIAECGSISDGCGGIDQCGTCNDDNDVCVDNTCCTPRTCADADVGCDATDDGCGAPLDCSCNAPLACDPTGSCCQALTCPDVCELGAYNGPDNCGGTLICPSCAAPE